MRFPRLPRIATPRPLYVAIATMATAVLLPWAVLLVGWMINAAMGDWSDLGDHLSEVMSFSFEIGAPAVLIGTPIAALPRWLARRSILANLAGFAIFAALAPMYEVYRYPRLENWLMGVIFFAVFGAICLGAALLIGWFRRRPPPIDGARLTDTFG